MKKIYFILFSLLMAACFGQAATTEEVIASTLYHEARGETEVGMRAVASIIYNRAHQKRWAKLGYKGVCLQKKQFSCHNAGYKKANPKFIQDKKAFVICEKIAKEIMTNKFKPTHTGNHYCTNNCKVYWKKLLKNKTVIRNHTFGTL